jgi:pimeloyl-ACP methyl ester carboxylesterase
MAFFTTKDGCRLYYQTHGFDSDKPVVAFLNGTTQTAPMWRPQALFFKNEFRVLCYDARAQGKSDLGRRALSIDLHVEDLLSLFTSLHIDRAHLVGLSHGAQVALAFAALHPQRAARLVLCSVGAEPGPRTLAVVRSWLEILTTGNLATMGWAALPIILGETYLGQNETLLPKMVKALAARNRKASLLAHLEALLTYPPPSIHATAVSQPCLVLSGSEDLLNHTASARRLAEMTNAGCEAFDRIGHSVPVEAAERFNRVCRRFLMEPSAP